MRDLVLVHAQSDSVASAAIAILNQRIAMTCAVTPGEPVGAFGPRFRLVFLWTPAAAGLEDAFAAMAARRVRAPIILHAGETPVPEALRSLGVVAPLQADAVEHILAEASFEVAPAPSVSTLGKHRRALGLAATAMLSIAGGAVLSGVAPASVSGLRAMTDRALAAPVSSAPDLDVDMVMRGADQILQNSRRVAESAETRARVALIRGVASSELSLSTAFSATPRAADLAPARPAAKQVQSGAEEAFAPIELRGVATGGFSRQPEIRVSLEAPQLFTLATPASFGEDDPS